MDYVASTSTLVAVVLRLGALQQGGLEEYVTPTLKSSGTSYVLAPPPIFTTKFILIGSSPLHTIVPAPLHTTISPLYTPHGSSAPTHNPVPPLHTPHRSIAPTHCPPYIHTIVPAPLVTPTYH